MQINKEVFTKKMKEDATKRGIAITDAQINSLIPELEDMFGVHDMFMRDNPPHQVMVGAFCAGVLHALNNFDNSKMGLRIRREGDGDYSVDYEKL